MDEVIEGYYPSAAEIMQRQKLRMAVLWTVLVGVTAVIFGAIGLVVLKTSVSGPVAWIAGAAILVGLVVPTVIWFTPRGGLYMMFATTLLTASSPLMNNLPTTGIHIWYNLSIVGQETLHTNALSALYFSTGEILMIWTFLCWLVRSISMRELHWRNGLFIGAMCLYLTDVAIGYFYGISTGGDKVAALREVRAQFLFLAAYLLAANLIRTKEQIKPLLWISVLAIGLNGFIGLATYSTMVGQVTEDGLPGLSHANSLHFNILFFVCFLTLITRSDRKLAIVSSLLAVPALVADLCNQRRAGIASFIIAFVPLLPLLWVAFQDRRRQIATFAVVFAAISAVYLPLAWNAKGPWALPARAIRSNTDPNERDSASNFYRDAENTDLKFTRDTKPWTGVGYGKYFIQVVPLPMVTTDLLYITPHNGILWVWMRLGHIGFLLFLMMFAAIFVKGAQAVKEVRDPLLRVVGILAILHMLMMFVYGKYDLQLIDPAQMVFSGMIVGVLGVLRELDGQKPAGKEKQAVRGAEDAPAEPAEPELQPA